MCMYNYYIYVYTYSETQEYIRGKSEVKSVASPNFYFFVKQVNLKFSKWDDNSQNGMVTKAQRQDSIN